MTGNSLRADSAERAAARPHSGIGGVHNAIDRGMVEAGLYGMEMLGTQPSEVAGTLGYSPDNLQTNAASGTQQSDLGTVIGQAIEGSIATMMASLRPLLPTLREIRDGVNNQGPQNTPTPINRNAHVER